MKTMFKGVRLLRDYAMNNMARGDYRQCKSAFGFGSTIQGSDQWDDYCENYDNGNDFPPRIKQWCDGLARNRGYV